jgi:hypothetical protein
MGYIGSGRYANLRIIFRQSLLDSDRWLVSGSRDEFGDQTIAPGQTSRIPPIQERPSRFLRVIETLF